MKIKTPSISDSRHTRDNNSLSRLLALVASITFLGPLIYKHSTESENGNKPHPTQVQSSEIQKLHNPVSRESNSEPPPVKTSPAVPSQQEPKKSNPKPQQDGDLNNYKEEVSRMRDLLLGPTVQNEIPSPRLFEKSSEQ